MSMRWMNLENTTLYTLLLLSVILIKSSNNSIFCLFSELSVQYKNTRKIKVLQMAWNLNMIFFWSIWEYLALRTQQGGIHLATRVEVAPYPLGVPPASWAHGGPPPFIPAPTHFFFLPKNHHPAQVRVLAHFAAIFDLLAQSTSHKTALGDCSLVCDSSNGPISFCSSALFITFFAAKVTLFLSLDVKFIWSKVVLMHDIASRHL